MRNNPRLSISKFDAASRKEQLKMGCSENIVTGLLSATEYMVMMMMMTYDDDELSVNDNCGLNTEQ